MCLCLSTCGYSTVLADEEELKEAPAGFAMREMRGTDGLMYRIQVSLKTVQAVFVFRHVP